MIASAVLWFKAWCRFAVSHLTIMLLEILLFETLQNLLIWMQKNSYSVLEYALSQWWIRIWYEVKIEAWPSSRESFVVSRALQLKVFGLGSVCIQYQGTLTVNSTNKIIHLIAVLQLSLHDYWFLIVCDMYCCDIIKHWPFWFVCNLSLFLKCNALHDIMVAICTLIKWEIIMWSKSFLAYKDIRAD